MAKIYIREQNAHWFRTAKNRDVSTESLAHLFARLLAPLTHTLAPYCSLRSCAPLHSFIRSLTLSLTPELVGK